jgi:lipid-binding SYLF domain-containing protein
MLVMNRRGMDKLLSSKFTLGADATVAAGPVGRQATAGTDARLSAEILSYSRSKGLFAGVSLAGATMRNDLDQNKELYGKPVTNKEVIGSNMAVPDAAQPLIAQLNKYSFHEAAAGTAASPATSTAGHQK